MLVLNAKQAQLLRRVYDVQQCCWKAQGGMLCPPWVETGPFEPSGLYRLIVQHWLRPSPLMSQHSRERINELVLGQMSSIVDGADNGGQKGTSVAVRV